jgi:hypothetical protein
MTANLGGWLMSSWRWLKRRRAAGWPIADGRIESTEVTKPKFSVHHKARLLRSANGILVFGRRKPPFKSGSLSYRGIAGGWSSE